MGPSLASSFYHHDVPRRIPRSLILVLATIAVLSFAVSLYLEFRQLNFLQAHPIMVNLISGVVGFSSGFLTLSIGVNWFLERQWIIERLGVMDGPLHMAEGYIRAKKAGGLRQMLSDEALVSKMAEVATFFELTDDYQVRTWIEQVAQSKDTNALLNLANSVTGSVRIRRSRRLYARHVRTLERQLKRLLGAQKTFIGYADRRFWQR